VRVLHTGYGKSGNSWLYTIVKLALDAAGHPDRGFLREHPVHQPLVDAGFLGLLEGGHLVDCFDVAEHGFVFEFGRTSAWAPILDVDDYVARCRQLWTHAHATDRLLEIARRVDRTVCIVRDVRDVAVSNARYMFSPANVKHFPQYRKGYANPQEYLDATFRGIVHDWANHVYGCLRRRDEFPMHIVLYERLLNQFDCEFDRLLAFLGLELDAAAKAAIKQQVSFDTMRTKGAEHVQVGKRNQWRKALTPQQQDLADCVAGPLLRLLGYPTSHETDMTADPEVPAVINFESWVDKPWPRPESSRIPYVDLVTVYREAMERVQRDGSGSIAVWGGDACGRAAVDAAELCNVRVDYVVDRNPAIQQKRLGGAPVVSPDDIGSRVPLVPFVIGSLNSVEHLQVEIRRRFNGQSGLKVYAPIPGRVPAAPARFDAPGHAAISPSAAAASTPIDRADAPRTVKKPGRRVRFVTRGESPRPAA
jgi:aryl sulfotransferase